MIIDLCNMRWLLLFIIPISVATAQPFAEVSDAVGLDYRYPGIQNHQTDDGVTVFVLNEADRSYTLYRSGKVEKD
jgi:hypothetical protein